MNWTYCSYLKYQSISFADCASELNKTSVSFNSISEAPHQGNWVYFYWTISYFFLFLFHVNWVNKFSFSVSSNTVQEMSHASSLKIQALSHSRHRFWPRFDAWLNHIEFLHMAHLKPYQVGNFFFSFLRKVGNEFESRFFSCIYKFYFTSRDLV